MAVADRAMAEAAVVGVAGKKPVPGGDVEKARAGTPAGSVVWMEAPEDLSETAVEFWNLLLPDLIALKVFQASDAALLSELVEGLAMAKEFRGEIQTLQEVQRERGKPTSAWSAEEWEAYEIISASLKRARTSWRQTMQTVMSISGEFGISPVARLRLGLMAKDGAKALHEMFGGGEDAGRA